MPKLETLRNGLSCALLAIACIVALQISFLLRQLSTGLETAEQELRATSRQAQDTLLYAQAVLTSVRGTTETIRKSAVEQTGYYEAIGRRSALALGRLDLLISHTDARMERITAALENSATEAGQSLDQFGTLAASARQDLEQVSKQAGELAAASTTTVQQLDQRLADDRLDHIASSLAQSSQNTAQATAHIEEATGYIRDMLSPARKSFWRRLLELLLPRPTVGVR